MLFVSVILVWTFKSFLEFHGLALSDISFVLTNRSSPWLFVFGFDMSIVVTVKFFCRSSLRFEAIRSSPLFCQLFGYTSTEFDNQVDSFVNSPWVNQFIGFDQLCQSLSAMVLEDKLSGVLTNILSLSRKAGWNYYLVSCRDGLPLLSPSFLSRSLILLAFSRWDFPIVPWHQANSFCQSCLWRLTTCQSSGDRHSIVSSVMLSASQDRSVWQTA